MNKQYLHITTALLCTYSAHAALVVEESFDYPAGTDITTLNGGKGFNGPWTVAQSGTGVQQVIQSNLSIAGALPSAGNSVKRSGNPGYTVLSRKIAQSAQDTFADNSSIWFSAIVNYKNNKDARPGFIFGTDGLDITGTPSMNGTGGSGFGFRFGTSIKSIDNYDKIYALGFTSGESQLSSDFYQTTATGNHLIVGEIAVGKLKLYVFTGSDTISTTRGPVATLTLPMNVSKFNTVSWLDNQIYGMDEVRLGTDFGSVTGDNKASSEAAASKAQKPSPPALISDAPKTSSAALIAIGGVTFMLR